MKELLDLFNATAWIGLFPFNRFYMKAMRLNLPDICIINVPESGLSQDGSITVWEYSNSFSATTGIYVFSDGVWNLCCIREPFGNTLIAPHEIVTREQVQARLRQTIYA